MRTFMNMVADSKGQHATKSKPMDLPKPTWKPDEEGQLQPRRVDQLLSPRDSPMSPPVSGLSDSGAKMDFSESHLKANEAGLVIKLKNEKSGWQLSAAEAKQKGRKQKTGNKKSDNSGTSTEDDDNEGDDESSMSTPFKDQFTAKRSVTPKEEDVDFDGSDPQFLPKKKGPSQDKPAKKPGEKRGRKPNSQVGPDGAKLEAGTSKRQRKNQTDSDSDDNFEVLPFKRRQFRPELEDESANMFVEKLDSPGNSQTVGVTTFNIPSNEQSQETLTPKLEPESQEGDGGEQPAVVKRKRGRPRKVQPTTPVINDNESSSSNSQGPFVKKYRSKRQSRVSFDSSDKDNSLSLEGSFDGGSDTERDFDNEIDKDDEDFEANYLKHKIKKKKGIHKKSLFGVPMSKMNGKQKFRCKICDKVLSNYWAFEAHRATVHGKRTFVCDVCNKAFKRKDHLANHKRSIHVVRTKYCLLCDLRFNRKIDLVGHIKNVHPDEYISAKEFLPVESSSPPKGSLSPSEMTEDDFSNDGFSTLEDFDEDSSSNLSKDDSVEPSEKRKRGRPKKMHLAEEFGEPVEMDYRLQCHTCAKAIEESTMAEHEKMWHKPVSCNYCSEEFFGCSRVFDHMLSHVQVLNDKTFYKCTSCMFRTLELKDLDDHFTEVHLRYHCNACESCIRGRIHAEDHIIDKHKPVCNANSTFFKCKECNEIFGALSDAQLHFLVHHFTKCGCEKHPKTITTCWQDWDEKLLVPEVLKSAPQPIPPRQISKPDGNQTSEVKPNPSLQKPYLRNACQACGVDMECYEDLIEHQAHHHRLANGAMPLVPLNGKKKKVRRASVKLTSPSFVALKSSPQTDVDLTSPIVDEGPLTSSVVGISHEQPLIGKENEVKGKKKLKKLPKKLLKRKKKIFLVSTFKRNLLQHMKSRKDNSYKDFFDDDDDDDDEVDDMDDNDHHSENYLPFGVPFHSNQQQPNDFLRRNIFQQLQPVQIQGENRVTSASGGRGQSIQQVATTPPGQTSSGSGGSQSTSSGQTSGDSNAQTSQSSAGSNSTGGTNSGSDNPQEPFPNRTQEAQPSPGSCTTANPKPEPSQEGEEANVGDSPGSELDFEALQNVSPNTLQRLAQGNEPEALDNSFTGSVNDLLEGMLPDNDQNSDKAPGSYDVVNWEDNGQFGSYLRRQNSALQTDGREGELNTPVLDGLENTAVQGGTEAPSVATPTSSGPAEGQTDAAEKTPLTEEKQVSEEPLEKPSGPKAGVSPDPESIGVSTDVVVNDIQFISTVFDNLSSPQSMDLLNIPGNQQSSTEPIFDQEASDLLDNILEDAEASARGQRRSPMQIARDSNLFPQSSCQVGLQEPPMDQHHQMQHAVAFQPSTNQLMAQQESFQQRANHHQAILMQQRQNELSGQSQVQPHQISMVDHHQQGRPQRIYDSVVYFQQQQQQQHHHSQQHHQFGLQFQDQRSQSIPAQRMASQQHMMSSQEMPGSPYNLGYQRGSPMVRPQQSHPGYQQQFLATQRHPYMSNNPHMVSQHHQLQQQQMYDRINAQDMQFQHQTPQPQLYQSQHQQTLMNRSMNYASQSDFSFSDRQPVRQSFQTYPATQQQGFQGEMSQNQMAYFRSRGNIPGNLMQSNEGHFPPPSKRPRQFDE